MLRAAWSPGGGATPASHLLVALAAVAFAMPVDAWVGFTRSSTDWPGRLATLAESTRSLPDAGIPTDLLVDLEMDLSRWAMPEHASSTFGLGGGLAFAIDPRICDMLLPLLPGSPLCAELKGMIEDSFRVWSSYAPHVVFVDVSATCASRLAESDPNATCPEAEIWVSADHLKDASAAAITSTFTTRADEHVLGTDARYHGAGMIYKASIDFNIDQCWNTDSSTCAALKGSIGDDVGFQYIIISAWLVLLLVSICLLLMHFKESVRRPGRPERQAGCGMPSRRAQTNRRHRACGRRIRRHGGHRVRPGPIKGHVRPARKCICSNPSGSGGTVR